MRRTLAVIAALGLSSAACGSSDEGALEFGVRRLALDLAFVDEGAAPPAAPEVIVRVIPAPVEAQQPGFDFDTVRPPPDEPPPPPPPPPADRCPSAPPEATVRLVASPEVIDPPAPGSYPRTNSGTIEVIAAGLPLRLPYPFASTWTVAKEAKVERPGPLGVPGTGATVRQFTVTKAVSPSFTVTETYEIGAEALLLVERRTVSNGAETVIRTTPALEFFKFGAEGDEWVSAGADSENGFGVVIQGSIADREVIDVCGDLVDTFVVEYTEQVVNLVTGETSGTAADEPSKIYIAPQYGGLVVREDLHVSQRATTGDGEAAVVNFDYISTLDSIDPG